MARGATIAHLQSASTDGGHTAVVVGTVEAGRVHQCQRASASLGQPTRAGDLLVHRDVVAAIERQCAVVVDGGRCSECACGAAIANLQSACADGGRAAPVVVGCERGGACARLGHSARARNFGTDHQSVIAAVKNQGTVVGDGTCTNGARRTTVANLQGACIDGGGAGVIVVARQNLCARAVFDQVQG